MGYKGLQGVRKGYRGLQEVTGMLRELQIVKKVTGGFKGFHIITRG